MASVDTSPDSNSEVYDSDANFRYSPEGRRAQAGGKGNADDTRSLAEQESNPRSSSGDTDQDPDRVGKGYTGGAGDVEEASLPEGGLKPKRRFWNARRAGFAGTAAGIAVVTMSLIMPTGVVMYKLAHLGNLVHLPLSHQENAGDLRFGAMWRWYKSGDITQLRLGFLTSRITKSIDAKLGEKGYVVKRSAAGYMSSITIDTTKPGNTYTGTNEERKAAIERDFGGRATNVGQIRDGKFAVTFSDRGAGANIAQWKAAGRLSRLVSAGKLGTAVAFRVQTKRFDIPLNPLNPLKAADKKINQAVAEWIKKRNTRVRSFAGKFGRVVTAFKASMGGKIVLTGLSAGGTVCAARIIYNGISDAGYATQIIPSMREAGDYMAAWSQIVAAPNTGKLDMDAARYLYERTVEYDRKGAYVSDAFQADAVRAADGKEGGIPPPEELVAAHHNIGQSNMNFLNSEPVKTVCEGATGAVFMSLSLIATAASGGILSAAGGVLTGSAALIGAQKLANSIFAPDALLDPRGSPLGSVIMSGGHDLALNNALGFAGTLLTSQQSGELDAESRALAAQDFQSKSFASRMFDTRDPDSLLGRIATGISPSTTVNMMNFATGLPSAGQSIVHSFASIMPSAHAAPLAYNYGGPDYGFSQADLNNPLIQDPFENGAIVQGMLDGSHGDEIIAKAQRCFGVIIDKDPHGRWGARVSTSPDSVINVYNPAYDSTDCAGGSIAMSSDTPSANTQSPIKTAASIKTASTDQDNDWLRVRFFILDSRMADSYACYAGDNEACQYMGISSVIDSTLTETTGDTSTSSDTPDSTDDETTPATADDSASSAVLMPTDRSRVFAVVGSNFARPPLLPRPEVTV